MSKFHAKPIVAKKSTRPGESSEYVGTRNTVDLLPAIFQTSVNKKFLNSTLEQLMSSGSMEAVNYYVGDRKNKDVTSDRFLTDGRSADQHQVVPGGVVRDNQDNIIEAISYDDLIDMLKFNEVDTTNVNRILNEPGYTLDLPINYDMFINHHHYFWLVDFLPVCTIPVTAADPIHIPDIIGLPYYKTPTLSNGKQLPFQNGMRVRFTGADASGSAEYNKDHTYIVDGVGTGISLTKQFEGPGTYGFGKRVWFNDTIYGAQEPSQWDTDDYDFTYPTYDFTSYDVLSRDYVVEERNSPDQSVWSRRNLWIHEDVVKIIADYTDYQHPGVTASTYLQDNFRGVRPIIEFKAGIEKYNFATSSLGSVTHIVDNVADPFGEIIGQTNWNLAVQTITASWTSQGFEYGSSVKLTSNGVDSFWNCIKTHTTSKNPSYVENAQYWSKVEARNLADGDTILFLNSSVGFNNNIYSVQVNSGGTVTGLTQIYGPSATTVPVKAGINVRIGYNNVLGETYPNNIYSGSEWYWDGNEWIYAQQKSYRSQGIKFNLYDTTLTPLDNSTKYPNSTFAGDNIFNYGTSNTKQDIALGFSPRYVDYGNTPGLGFDIDLGSKRYNYVEFNSVDSPTNNDASNTNEITGFYYYKKDDEYYNGWSEVRDQQPVKQHIQHVATNVSKPLVIDIGTTDIESYDTFKWSERKNKLQVHQYNKTHTRSDSIRVNGLNPRLFIDRNKTYNIVTNFDIYDLEFLNPDGTAFTVAQNISLSTPSNNERTLLVPDTYFNAVILYRRVSDANVYGYIYVNNNSIADNLTITKNGEPFTAFTLANNKVTISNGILATDDLIDIEWHTLDNTLGSDTPADTHILNPQNEVLSQVSFGDILNHMKQQITGIPGLDGDFYGINNYRNLPRVHEFGGTIRKQAYSTELLTQTSMFTDTNLFSSLNFATKSYSNFKRQFIQKCKQLHNTLNSSASVITLVDEALKSMNIGKSRVDLFANSQMLKFKEFEELNSSWTASDTPVFDLPQTVNTYDDTKNHIQVFIREDDGSGNTIWRPLIKDQEYTVTQNKLTITTSVTYDSNGQVLLNVRWFSVTSPSWVPPSAVKLGLMKPTAIEATSTEIVGHDGSRTLRLGNELYNRNVAGFNIQDAVLFEIETRIYNNLTDIDIVDYKEIMPSASLPNRNTWEDLNNALHTSFNKWKIRNNVTVLHDATEYSASDPFTWNYSSMGPGIGGWRGLYTYYFNTYRPDTHPWEMLGYNKKPTWWDTSYSWTDAAKRAALIGALKTGQYSDPTISPKKYSITYAYSAYNWDIDTLVTNAGVLNDPDTANVVGGTPLYTTTNDFVYGDWGTIENTWRESSDYKIALFHALLKLRPLRITNDYFRSNTRTKLDNVNTVQVLFSDTNDLGNNKLTKLTNKEYDENIVELVNVVDGGTGYSSAPQLNVFSNFGSGVKLQATVDSGSITSVAVVDPGGNYQTTPSIIPADLGTTKFTVILASDVKSYIDGLNNALVNFAEHNSTKVDTIETRFKNYSTNPIIKAGGFVNNNQEIILESSQDKGRVNIPEENISTVLYTSQPKEELFLGAVKVTKVATGYKVSGYDTTKEYFTYFKPQKDDGFVITLAGSQQLNKYKYHSNSDSILDYNTIFGDIQSLYDFIIGYGEYLQSKGWKDSWTSVAAQAVIWSQTAELTDIHYTIPNTTKIEILENNNGYFSNINNKFDGQYNIISKAGLQILNNKLTITRDVIGEDDGVTVIEAKNGTEIYGIRLYRVEIEHMLIIDNQSNFDDLIYDPALGLRHKRVIWRGSRTKNWNGKLFAPGYIVNSSSVVPNFDTVANEIDQYYGAGNTLSNQQQVDAARFNTGYNKPIWNEVVGLDDDTLFNFVKGSRKYRGTRHALNAFMRNTGLFGTLSTATVHEEWAIRTADYGDTRSRNTLEFELTTDLLKTNPQPVRFSSTELNDILSDIVIDVDFNSPLLVNGIPGNNFTTRPPKTFNYTTIEQENIYANDFVTAGLPLLTETDYRVLNKEDFAKFPQEVKPAYKFDGNWKTIKQWDNKTAYKYKDRVIYAGRVWEMLDPDGTSGLTKPNDPIEITATVTLPSIRANEETKIITIDGIDVELRQTTDTTTFGIINVTGSNNIGDSNVVPDNSTLILGSSSTNARTVTFDSTVTTTTYNDVSIVGNTSNPSITGSSTKELIIESQSILFNELESTTTNISALSVWEDALTIAGAGGSIPSLASARITATSNLRTEFLLVDSEANWNTWWTSYTSSAAGFNLTFALSEYGAGHAYSSAVGNLITSDVNIINAVRGTSYVPADVLAGTEVVTTPDITATQSAVGGGTYIAAWNTYVKGTFSPSVISNSTIIDTISTSGFKIYNVAEIINKINDQSIPNVLATATAQNRIAITKTTNTPSNPFTLTISVASANADVGFSTIGSQTETSSGSINLSSPNLTITQVVNQINNANISGVTAQAGGVNLNVLQINSNNETLYIGSGTANSIIGLGSGVTNAPITTTTVSSSVDLNSIINIINDAAISGIGASNSNNRLKLTSTNSTLVIGGGTANSIVGLTAGTISATQTQTSNVFNAFVGSDGNQVFQQMENDPHVFSIWVADNVGDDDSSTSGYGVYQTMDFGMHIQKACAGNNDADDALINIKIEDHFVNTHNFTAGDYVLIAGSNTVPNIDGIHLVTDVSSANTASFFIDEYIQEEGNAGNVYPIRNVRFPDFNTLNSQTNATVNGLFKYNFQRVRQDNLQSPIYAFVDDDGTGAPGVYTWNGSFTNSTGHTGGNWVKVRTSTAQARNDLVESVKLYDAYTRSTIAQLEVFDPAKGIIPGFIDEEIDFTLTADIAVYNYNSIDGFTENTKSWTSNEVGVRWWDINTAIYVDYEQSSIDYKQAYWARLFDGASIDVYEWTRSSVPPEEWQELVLRKGVVDGSPATGVPLSSIIDNEVVYNWTEEIFYNSKTKRTEKSYYFWVKDKQNNTGSNRNYNTYQLARLLENPSAFDISWAAAAGNNELLMTNIDSFITNNTVVQVNQRVDSNALPLSEWTLLSENDPASIIPEQLHIKMRDSLTGYNRHTVRYTYTDWNNSAVYPLNAVVKEGNLFYICLVEGNTGNQPSLDTDMELWARIYDYSLPEGTPESDIDVLRPHALPDLNLHEYARYGHLIRPRQSLFRNILIARQNFVETANNLLADIPLAGSPIDNWETVMNKTYVEGEVTYDVSPYWGYTDYVRRTYDNNDSLTYEYNTAIEPKYVANDRTELMGELGVPFIYKNGDTLKINTVIHNDGVNRPEIYSRINNEWVLEYKVKGAIRLSEELWNNEKFGLGFDLGGFDTDGFDNAVDGILSNIFDGLRNRIFVGKHKVKYNKLWFKCLYQSIADNAADDFAFKTTFVKLNVDHPLLTAKKRYGNYSVNVIEDFFNTIKPFHTKLHSTADRNTFAESWTTEIDDNDRKTDITMKYEDHRSTRIWAGDTVLEGGTFTTAPDNVDAITFTTVDGDIEYIYDANIFQQSTEEGWGAEFLPMDVHENISILVQTDKVRTAAYATGTTSNSLVRRFVDLETMLGGVPNNASLTQCEYRGDFATNSEYIDVSFDDGSTFRVGEFGGADSPNYATSTVLTSKDLTPLLVVDGGKTGVFVEYDASAGVNFSPSGMSNWWDVRLSFASNWGVGSDTRSFRMNIWETYRLYESSVIVDATSTVVTTTIIASDHDAFMVADASGFPDSGVVWVGNERIEYGAKGTPTILGTTLFYCTRGTYGTPVLTNTPIGTTVRYEPRVPILDNFGHYGDNLRLAYNDSGVSLADAGTSTEHAFIRNAGSGSI